MSQPSDNPVSRADPGTPADPGAPADPGTPAGPGRYGWSQRAIAIVLMMAAILVAGGIAGVANALDEADTRLFTDVDQGQQVRIGDDATLRITGISVGGNLTDRDALVATSGRYVVVEYEVVAGPTKAPSVRVELHADGLVYRGLEKSYEPLPAGFGGNRATLFEVPTDVLPGDVDIVFGTVELVYSHQHWVRWRQTISADEVTRSQLLSVSMPETTMWVAP